MNWKNCWRLNCAPCTSAGRGETCLIAVALENTKVDPERVVKAFGEYMPSEGHKVTRAQFGRNLAAKFRNAQFIADIGSLLAASYEYDRDKAAQVVSNRLVALLPGAPWKKPKPRK
jgi:hypothetical protein